jgi:hypothetical protein
VDTCSKKNCGLNGKYSRSWYITRNINYQMCFWDIQKGVIRKNFKNEELKKKGTYYNWGIKGHFAKTIPQK